MTRLEKKLRAALRHLGIGESAKVLVAVSGGADSTALLSALAHLRSCNKAPKTIVAAHLNHLLRAEESDADERFVRELATQLNVSLQCERIDVGGLAENAKQNLEAFARQTRYEFLRRAAEQFNADVIVTAHTQDDQVETLLMRLLRGTGTAGLRGIHQQMELPQGLQLARPLLKISRAEVMDHCQCRQLTFRTDSSNFSRDLTRNRVRHELLPLLRSFNPRFEESLLRLTDRITEDDDDLQTSATEIFQTLCDEQQALNVTMLRLLTAAKRRRVLRLWLREMRRDLRRIEESHLLAIEKLVMGNAGGKFVELPGGWQVWRKKQKITILNDTASENAIH